jgi:uncharacterized protein YqkB
MRIEPSTEAVNQLLEFYHAEPRLLKIAYDSEGCGCAVSGIAQLWQVGATHVDDMIVCDGPVTILIETRHEVFFDEVMRLDYSPDRKCFILKSDGQIYHNSLRVINKTGGKA